MNKTNMFDVIKDKLRDYFNYALIVLLSAFIFSLANNILSINRANLKIAEAEERVSTLKEENEELEGKLGGVENDLYVEAQLRDSLGLAKDGEIVLILPEDETLKRLAPKLPVEEQVLPDPNWRKWLNLFI